MNILKMLYYFKKFRLALYSHIQADIPKTTHFHHHGFGVVIGKGVKLGEDVHIYQGVTIGSKKQGGKSVPVIGDNAIIYPNSVIVGNIKIGDNCVIGACSFVNRNVPAGCSVSGVPACIVVSELKVDNTKKTINKLEED